jgi:hypothetical protein
MIFDSTRVPGSPRRGGIAVSKELSASPGAQLLAGARPAAR